MNFNDYYNYVNGYSDFNYMANPNNMINDLNYQSLMPNDDLKFQNFKSSGNNASNNNGILDSYEGFKRGNMYAYLYDPYKNYKPSELKANSEREDMLMQIQELKFAMIDLGLYLDLNDNDQNAIKLFNDYLKKEKELCKMFENKYGPLTFDNNLVGSSWKWDNGPWPWEVQR